MIAGNNNNDDNIIIGTDDEEANAPQNDFFKKMIADSDMIN